MNVDRKGRVETPMTGGRKFGVLESCMVGLICPRSKLEKSGVGVGGWRLVTAQIRNREVLGSTAIVEGQG